VARITEDYGGPSVEFPEGYTLYEWATASRTFAWDHVASRYEDRLREAATPVRRCPPGRAITEVADEVVGCLS
jgi:hypothetical protein